MTNRPFPIHLLPVTKLEPIRRKSLSDEVFDQLRAKIVSGEMAPGSTLPAERALCEMLGVNRGALREALKRLEQARLVSIQHGGGTTVADFRQSGGLDLLSQMILRADGRVDTLVARSVVEMRGVLGPDIARLAALRADELTRAALIELVDQMKDAPDTVALQTLGMRFWDLLVEGSGNVAYRFAYNTLQETYSRIADVMVQILETELTDLSRYRAIVEAVNARDAVVAEAKARALLDQGAQGILQVLEMLEQMNGAPQ